MRGDDNQQEGMFSYVSPEKRVPADHPLRPMRKMVDEILEEMSPQFAKLYSDVGRPPERETRQQERAQIQQFVVSEVVCSRSLQRPIFAESLAHPFNQLPTDWSQAPKL